MARIIVADDEPEILDIIQEVLETAGHEVLAVSDGLQALNTIERNKFDIAFLDVMMPKLNGFQVVAKIHGFKNPPKIVIVTARNYEKDAETLELIGVSAYLQKPFKKRDILDIASTLLRDGGLQQ